MQNTTEIMTQNNSFGEEIPVPVNWPGFEWDFEVVVVGPLHRANRFKRVKQVKSLDEEGGKMRNAELPVGRLWSVEWKKNWSTQGLKLR